MGLTERVWGALTSMIKLEDKVVRQGEVIKAQQLKIENLTERLIRLETTIELLMRAVSSAGFGDAPHRSYQAIRCLCWAGTLPCCSRHRGHLVAGDGENVGRVRSPGADSRR